MTGWQAFWTGLRTSFRYPQVLLSLWVANLLTALLLVVPPALGLAAGLGHRPALRQAADGLDAWLVLETLLAPTVNGSLAAAETGANPSLQGGVTAGLATLPALPLLAWLTAAFLYGGLLRIYAETGQPFHWRGFLRNCWHWFGPFLLVGLLQGLVGLVGVGVALAAAAFALVVGGWLIWLAGVGLLAWLAFWLILLEYTRACAVVGQTRSPLRAFGQAVTFIIHHLPAVAGLYGPALLLLGLLYGLYYGAGLSSLPPAWWPLAFLATQVFILSRLVAQAGRLAGVVAQLAPSGLPGGNIT